MSQPSEPAQWITFRLGSEIFAQPIDSVKEVIPYQPPVPVPGAPREVEGMLNVRGEVITVLSGPLLLPTGSRPAPERTRILILDTANGKFGVSVEAVAEIVTIDPQRIEPPADRQPTEWMIGTTQQAAALLVLIDLVRYDRSVATDQPHSG